jgi:hypothetical protein
MRTASESSKSSKWPTAPCGDVFACARTEAATTIVCADGVGSGIRARMAAQMCTSRILDLLKLGFSLRKAMASVVRTMQQNRDPSRPFTAFSVARILNDGMATILGYEAPPAILVGRRHAVPLPTRSIEIGAAMVAESDCWLEPGEGLLLMSDGITQAGLGNGLPNGWGSDGVAGYMNHCLTSGTALAEIPELVCDEARRLSPRGGDDCTVLLALCRPGQVVNILTGPPRVPAHDWQVASAFLKAKGLKIVCGGTTAEIVARTLGQAVRVDEDGEGLVAPPRYEIEGVDLVTEGVVTLNQVCNLLDEPLDRLTEDSGVTELCAYLQTADRVNITYGTAKNRSSGDISFRQQGILTRERILSLIADKLREAGKLVVVRRV